MYKSSVTKLSLSKQRKSSVVPLWPLFAFFLQRGSKQGRPRLLPRGVARQMVAWWPESKPQHVEKLQETLWEVLILCSWMGRNDTQHCSNKVSLTLDGLLVWVRKGALGAPSPVPVVTIDKGWDARLLGGITSWRVFSGKHSLPFPVSGAILLDSTVSEITACSSIPAQTWQLKFAVNLKRGREEKTCFILYKYLFKNSYIIHIFYIQNRNNRSSNRNSNS